jgi:hypothetical protein
MGIFEPIDQKVRNEEVCVFWLWNMPAHSGNMRTDGKDLYSYGLKIGYTPDWRKVVVNYTAGGKAFRSMTTSHHVGIAAKYADIVVNPDKGV